MAKGAYAAETDGGLDIRFGWEVTEDVRNLELLSVKSVDLIAKKHVRAANAAIEQSPLRFDEETKSTPVVEDMIARIRSGKWQICVGLQFRRN